MKKPETTFLFFTGKGGVGKTSLACASAIALADSGKRVLLISTDPASNLTDVLECPVNDKIRRVAGTENLFALNIDPESAAEDYRNRVIQPLSSAASAEEINKIREDLSGACTTEIASFDEFSRFISGEQEDNKFDTVVFDTAPTGHTLRLLELPAAWSDFSGNNPAGASCLGPASALKSSRERYQTVVEKLRDASFSTFFIVARTDLPSLKEASRTSSELARLGMKNQSLYINGVFRALDRKDPLAVKMESMAEQQLHSMPDNLKNLPQKFFPLLPYNLLGIRKLRSLFDPALQQQISVEQTGRKDPENLNLPGISELCEELCRGKKNGLILTMGKGGVGKTIAASAIALTLAGKGFEVLLTTTDPAAHIRDFISQTGAIPPTLTIEQINPKEETQRYIEKIMEQKGQGKTEEEKKLIFEDLKSPCTEEVAVFNAFSKAIRQASRKFVVIDTAPTGHTLLLLDTAGSYHREILKNNPLAGKLRTPYMALQDSDVSRIILVTLPETTPVREAASLQEDLKRAGIRPWCWLINQSLSMVKGISDPLLKSRATAETAIIQEVNTRHSERAFGIPFLAEINLLPAVLHSNP
jgi:arsenite-transporting ATPase